MFNNLPPTFLLSLSALFWAGNFVVGRWAHATMPPLGLTFWRWFIAGLILLPFVGKDIWQHRACIRQNIGWFFVLALTGMAMFHSFTYIALATTTAINASFVLASMPMVIPIVSLVVGDERLNVKQTIGIAISIMGVVIIVSRGEFETLRHLNFAPGDLWILASVLAWSIYSVMLKRKPKALPPLVLLATTVYIAIVIMLPIYIWEYSIVGGFDVQPVNMLVIAYLAIFASIAAFVCWNTGVHHIGANKSGLFIHMIPLFASILSIIFLGETLKPYHFVGIAPILAGIYLTTTAKIKTKAI